MRKVAVFVDGGHLRACARIAGMSFTSDFVVAISRALLLENEELYRIQYYDCKPFVGELQLPVSGARKRYTAQDNFMDILAKRELVAVRQGTLKFRGWERTRASVKSGKSVDVLTDDDFRPKLEQKGVDLRIGLDVITITEYRGADMIILLTGDTDLIPAMKLARQRGIQIAGVSLPNHQCGQALRPHCDFIRVIREWPTLTGTASISQPTTAA